MQGLTGTCLHWGEVRSFGAQKPGFDSSVCEEPPKVSEPFKDIIMQEHNWQPCKDISEAKGNYDGPVLYKAVQVQYPSEGPTAGVQMKDDERPKQVGDYVKIRNTAQL